MRTVLVTGGTCRVGRAISRRLAENGWNVIASSHRSGSGADVICDFTRDGALEHMFGEIERILRGAHPDAVVNNAALFTGEDDDVYKVGFEAPKRIVEFFSAGRAALSVVNILDADLTDVSCEPRNSYEKAKRDLMEFTLNPAGVSSCALRMNAVALGPVLPPAGVHVKAKATPLGRPTLQAAADAVKFLLDAEYTSGCIIPVSGYCPRTV